MKRFLGFTCAVAIACLALGCGDKTPETKTPVKTPEGTSQTDPHSPNTSADSEPGDHVPDTPPEQTEPKDTDTDTDTENEFEKGVENAKEGLEKAGKATKEAVEKGAKNIDEATKPAQEAVKEGAKNVKEAVEKGAEKVKESVE